MIIREVSDLPLQKNPHGVELCKLYDHDTAQAMHLTLKPGQSLRPHITSVDVFFYVIEGTASIQVGDEIKEVKSDCLVESPKDIVHCIANHSESRVRVMVVKAPKQTEKAILV